MMAPTWFRARPLSSTLRCATGSAAPTPRRTAVTLWLWVPATCAAATLVVIYLLFFLLLKYLFSAWRPLRPIITIIITIMIIMIIMITITIIIIVIIIFSFFFFVLFLFFSDVVYGEQFSSGERTKFYKEVVPQWLGSLEKLLGAEPFFVGGHLTWADFVVFDLLEVLVASAAFKLPDETPGTAAITNIFVGLPKLAGFYAAFQARPRIAAYLGSDRRLPFALPKLPPASVPSSAEAAVRKLLASEPVLTISAPGKWAGKEATHVPKVRMWPKKKI